MFDRQNSEPIDIALLGIPASRTSLSQSMAHLTPDAIRKALQRYSTAHHHPSVNIQGLSLKDFGNIASTDDDEVGSISELRTIMAKSKLSVVLGGDNSITFAGVQASNASSLITLDAHYDLRDGKSNGSPVRRLIESGLPGTNIVQIGIADFSNSPAYSQRAKELGITVVPRSVLRTSSPSEVWNQALKHVNGDIFVDIDMDICDRSVVPACPASAPGGISADELRQFAYLAGSTDRVVGIDITEIDSSRDTDDERTVRLAALAILEIAAGYSLRE